MVRALIFAALLVGIAVPGRAGDSGSGPVLQVGRIYFFGAAGADVDRVSRNLPVHAGETLDLTSFDRIAQQIRRVVLARTGSPATDVEAVCCDSARHLLIYIGLRGRSWKKLHFKRVPRGSERLTPPGLQLYEEDEAAVAKAVESGATGEDDSQGFALADDPAARKIELEMRGYAAGRGPELERVLRNSGSGEEREASACLLGYADRSDEQIRGLVSAAMDPDADVRNNAVRALAVLFSGKAEIPAGLNLEPLIELLWSGEWTDRNKASAALAAMTRSREPGALAQLRTAMPPLLEGARWDEGHRYSFLLILGRVAGVPEPELQNMLKNGDAAAIVAAAEKVGPANR